MQLELNDVEVAALRETLENVLPDLSYEIANTDQLDFRNRLKDKRDALKRVFEALERAG